LNVVVCGKVIPASTVTIEIDPNTKRMARKGVPHELDPAAASAVEEGAGSGQEGALRVNYRSASIRPSHQ